MKSIEDTDDEEMQERVYKVPKYKIDYLRPLRM